MDGIEIDAHNCRAVSEPAAPYATAAQHEAACEAVETAWGGDGATKACAWRTACTPDIDAHGRLQPLPGVDGYEGGYNYCTPAGVNQVRRATDARPSR
jgi:hypothetical protein